MTTTEELISHPHQVLCGEDVGPATVPWSVAEAWAEYDAEPAGPAWPTEDLDTPTDVFASAGQVEVPVEAKPTTVRGRHRLRRATAREWWAARWPFLLLLFLTNTGTGILASIATYLNWRPILAAGAVFVVVAGLAYGWHETNPRGGAR